MQKQLPLPGEHMNVLMEMKADSTKHMAVAPKKLYRNIVPDVTGMSLKDAVYMLENSGMQVTVKGKGKVSVQSITPGTLITKGQNIRLQLG